MNRAAIVEKLAQVGAIAAAVANHAAAAARHRAAPRTVEVEHAMNDAWVEMAEALIDAAPWLLPLAEVALRVQLAADGIAPGPWRIGTYFGPGAYLIGKDQARIAIFYGPQAEATASFVAACHALRLKE